MKISIIGAGNVGGLTAIHLCASGFSEIVLIDKLSNLAHAKALDASDAQFIYKHNYHIQGTDDINQIADSEIIVITAGMPRRPGMSREQLVQNNSQIIKGVCLDIKRLSPKSIIIVVTNPLDIMTYLVIKQTGLPARRVLGMGLTLDRARLANLIAEALNVAVTEIEPCVIGSHGAGMLPLSRYTKVKGMPLDNYLQPKEINELFQKTVQRGAEIVSYLGSGSAYFAPSAAIFEIAKAVSNNENCVLPVSAYLCGEYGIDHLCIGTPCRLGKEGIEEIIELELNQEEKITFLKSAEAIKKQIVNIDCNASKNSVKESSKG